MHYNVFSEERYKYLCGLSTESKKKWRWNDFTLDEINEIIRQCCFDSDDLRIATLKKIQHLSNEKIAEKMGMDRKTIARHCIYIRMKCVQTAMRMFSGNNGHEELQIPKKIDKK